MTGTRQEQFWMVYGIGQRSPTHRHWTQRDAEAEADRLARANAGVTFVVLEARSSHVLPLPPIQRLNFGWSVTSTVVDGFGHYNGGIFSSPTGAEQP